MKYLLFVIFLSIPCLVLGHGWLVSPQPRGYAGDNVNSASGIKPCGMNGTFQPPTPVTNLGQFTITYNVGSGHDTGTGEGMCYFSLARNMDNQDNIFYSVPCTASNGDISRNTTVFFAPLGSSPETLYLQFVWKTKQGSIWYSCAKVTLSPSAYSMDLLPVGKSVSQSITASGIDYYKTTLAANEFFYMEAKAPSSGGITVALKSNNLPTTINYDSQFQVGAGKTVGLSTCSFGNTSRTGFITVTAGSATSGTYSLQTSSYTGFIDYASVAFPQISSSSAGMKLYSALAFSTVDIPKRIVVRADGPVGLTQSLICEISSAIQASGDDAACLDLSKETDIKYIQVTTNGKTAYTLGIEDGDCSTFSDASSVAVSIVLIISLLVLLL